MDETFPTERSFQASITALVFAALAIACFIPPLNDYVGVLRSPLLAAMLGITIGAAYSAHLVFLGMTAARMGRSVVGWLLLAVLLAPFGSIIALIVLGFHGAETGWRSSDKGARIA